MHNMTIKWILKYHDDEKIVNWDCELSDKLNFYLRFALASGVAGSIKTVCSSKSLKNKVYKTTPSIMTYTPPPHEKKQLKTILYSS